MLVKLVQPESNLILVRCLREHTILLRTIITLYIKKIMSIDVIMSVINISGNGKYNIFQYYFIIKNIFHRIT